VIAELIISENSTRISVNVYNAYFANQALFRRIQKGRDAPDGFLSNHQPRNTTHEHIANFIEQPTYYPPFCGLGVNVDGCFDSDLDIEMPGCLNAWAM